MRRRHLVALIGGLVLFLSKVTDSKADELSLAVQRRAAWVRTALTSRGVPYRWGGTSVRGFDCSGLTAWVARHQGINLPHSASAQSHFGIPVALSRLQAGDLLFFRRGRGIGHVGLYIGNGCFIHAPRRGRRVAVESLSGWYRRRLVTARTLCSR